jgi:hypothetical protein
MNSTYFGIFLSQLLTQSPLLLVYLIGIVVCAVWWRRAPMAAMLALAGFALLLLTSVGFAFIQQQLIQSMNRGGGGGGAVNYAQSMLWIGIASSILRAAATALLLIAVFIGRPKVAEVTGGGFEVQQQQQQYR